MTVKLTKDCVGKTYHVINGNQVKLVYYNRNKGGTPYLGVCLQDNTVHYYSDKGSGYQVATTGFELVSEVKEKRKLTGVVDVHTVGNAFELHRYDPLGSPYARLDLSKYNIEYEEGEGLEDDTW